MIPNRRVDSLFEITNDVLDRIRKQIGEDEERLQHVEQLLHQWIQCVQYLPENYDKRMVRNFIRGAKFNLDITKKKLEGYFLAKYAYPSFYRERDPKSEEIIRAFDTVNIVRLPKLTEEGERVCVLSLADPDPDILDMTALLKLFWMLYDLTLTCELPVLGEILIFDCSNFTPGHVIKFLSMPFKNSITILRDAYAARLSQIHVINCPPVAEKVIAMVRPLLHEKVKKRFMVHKGTDSLLSYLPPKVLPSDMGGNLESVRDYKRIWQEALLENSDWFQAQESVNIVGTPSKSIDKFATDIGLEGSFRKLNID